MRLSILVAPLVCLLLTRAAFAQPRANSGSPEAAAPASESIAAAPSGGYACAFGEHAGMDDDDARTASDVICAALAEHHARPEGYDIRVGKLGSKLLLSVSGRTSRSQRQLFIEGPDEIPLAADRIATAFVENETVAETQGADNVVSSEVASTPLRKKAPISIFLGMVAAQGVGYQDGMSAGAEADVALRVHKFELALQGRAGGAASGENFVGFWSVGAVGRYYVSDSDAALFVGAGPEVTYLKANEHDVLLGYTGMGFGAAAEVGASFYRSSKAGALVALRADVPAFTLTNTSQSFPTPDVAVMTTTSMYVAAVSMTFGLAFR